MIWRRGSKRHWACGVALGLSLVGLGARASAQDESNQRETWTKVSNVSTASYAQPDLAPRIGNSGQDDSDEVVQRHTSQRRYGSGVGPRYADSSRFTASGRYIGTNRHTASNRSANSQGYASRDRYAMRQPAADDSDMMRRSPHGASGPVSEELPSPVAEGSPSDMHYSPAPFDEFDPGDDEYDSCDGGCGDECGWFDGCGCMPSRRFWENFSVFSGAEAFKGPTDRGINGDFGYHEGFNWAMPLMDECGIAGQFGFQAVQTDLSGGFGIRNHRQQYFLTSGLFRRACGGCGWQGGAVIDYLHDDYFVRMNLTQVRAEISYLYCCHEVGFDSAVHTSSQRRVVVANETSVRWKSTDLYTFFYRHYFDCGAVARVFSGFTGNGDGLVGTDTIAPISQRLALQAGYTYRIPKDSGNALSVAQREDWGLAISLVWYPGFMDCGCCKNPYRPLFNAADNTSFLINQTVGNVVLQPLGAP